MAPDSVMQDSVAIEEEELMYGRDAETKAELDEKSVD